MAQITKRRFATLVRFQNGWESDRTGLKTDCLNNNTDSKRLIIKIR